MDQGGIRGTRRWTVECIPSPPFTGFGLTALCIAHERKYAPREDIEDRVLQTLRFVWSKLPHERGFYYHFVNCQTGERVWHYQLVHHDLWDYDLPSAPVLADITVDGRRIRAAVQVTKQAFAFVFDRTNGRPVWPIEERPVPQSATPGEQTSPT